MSRDSFSIGWFRSESLEIRLHPSSLLEPNPLPSPLPIRSEKKRGKNMPSIVISRNHASGQNLVESTKVRRATYYGFLVSIDFDLEF